MGHSFLWSSDDPPNLDHAHVDHNAQDVDVAQSILATCNNCMDINWAAATTKLFTE